MVTQLRDLPNVYVGAMSTPECQCECITLVWSLVHGSPMAAAPGPLAQPRTLSREPSPVCPGGAASFKPPRVRSWLDLEICCHILKKSPTTVLYNHRWHQLHQPGTETMHRATRYSLYIVHQTYDHDQQAQRTLGNRNPQKCHTRAGEPCFHRI